MPRGSSVSIALLGVMLFLPGRAPLRADPLRTKIPGTRASVIVPYEWGTVVGGRWMLLDPTVRLSITAEETVDPLRDTYAQFLDSEYCARMGRTLLSPPVETTIGRERGLLFRYRRNTRLLGVSEPLSAVFLIGDSAASLWMQVDYPASAAADAMKGLTAIAGTLEWDRSTLLVSEGIFDVAIDGGSRYTLARREKRTMVFRRTGGGADTGFGTASFELLTTPESEPPVSDEGRGRYVDAVLARLPLPSHSLSVTGLTKTTVDSLPAFEATALTPGSTGGSKVGVYLCAVFHPRCVYLMAGFTRENRIDEDFDDFRVIARSFRRIQRSMPDHAACNLLLDAGRFREAAECFDAAYRADPGLLTAALGKADALALDGEGGESLRLYDDIISAHDTYRDAYTHAARVYMKTGEFGNAKGFIERGIWRFPGDDTLYAWRAVCQVELGHPEKAMEDFDKVMEGFRRDPLLLTARGRARAALGDAAGAEKNLSEAVEADKSFAPAYRYRADVRRDNGRYAEALTDYEQAIALARDDIALHVDAARAAFAAGSDSAAVRIARSGLRLNRRHPSLLDALGNSYAAEGRLDSAAAAFGEEIGSGAPGGTAFMMRGIIRFLAGKYKEASTDIRNGLQRGDTPMGRIWLYLVDGRAYPTSAQPRRQLRQYAEASMTDQPLDSLTIRYVLGDVDEATLVRRSKELGRGSAWSPGYRPLCNMYLTLGLINELTGLKIKAREYWQEALKTRAIAMQSYAASRLCLAHY